MTDTTPLPASPFDLAIVGAGISGLCLARLAARKGLRVLMLEKHPEAGGCLCSVPVGGPEPQGWLELGAHTCYNSYQRFLDLMAGTDLLSRATSRKGLGFRMVERGVMRSIPSCLDFLEAAWCLPRAFTARKAGQSAQAYYSRFLGQRNWDRVLHPALNAVASQDTAGFPADALFQRRPGRRKDVLRSFAVRGGLGAAAQALAQGPGIHLALERQAVDLRRTEDGFRLGTGRGETVTARKLAVATPPDAAAALLAAAFPDTAALLERIPTCTVKSLGLVFGDPLPHVPRLAGLILPGGPCFSAVSGDAFPVPGKRAFSFHFDGGRIEDPEEMEDYACQVLGTDPSLVEVRVRRYHTMPAIPLNHDRWLEALERTLAGGDLMVVGNYLSGMSIEDCAGRALRECARALGS